MSDKSSKSAPKVMKPVEVSPPYNSQFDIKKMALRDKKKARIHRKQIFETATKKHVNPKHIADLKKKRKKEFADKGIKTTLYD